jgi:RNA polymerase sigma-70 factor (ECF subfamily)
MDIGASPDRQLLLAARGGDEGAYERLVAPYHRELHAHCYRMLGSLHDAEDALQDALLRAWRGLARFEGRSSLRSWLYRIATNTCLDQIAKRPKRVLATEHIPPTDPHEGPGQPLTESVWIEPYPDQFVGTDPGPDTRYEQRESVELAFIAALQHLPARQRAALILRDVLGYSARETAAQLDTSTAAANSALQRARATMDDKLPEHSQQATLRSIGDEQLQALVTRYTDAWERGDIDGVAALLTEDAALTMPPLGSWFQGRDRIAEFLAGWPLSGAWQWRHLPARANGQAAVGCYCWDPDAGTHLPFALEVLSLRGTQIAAIDAFVNRSTEDRSREELARWAAQPAVPARTDALFARFGLPERLD